MRSLWVLAVLLLPSVAWAEVYSWTDDDGVIHFTNVPNDPRAKLHPMPNTLNTFEAEGLAKKPLHRVNVTRYDDIITEAARYYTLPPAFVKAIIAAESAFEPLAVSKAGAQGLMQLMPATARDMRVRDPFEPRANIYGGARYLRLMANRFNGDIRLTAAAYNAGPEAVERHDGVPPYQETLNYVDRVLELYEHYRTRWKAPR